jgi:soluble lytic murein transglycosylase-like protein
MAWRLGALALGLLVIVTAGRAAAGAESDAWSLCGAAIAAAERKAGLPPHLLKAIALAEAGRWHDASEVLAPWPWTVMAEGEGRFLATKAQAITAVRALHERNIRNIDVGCMQVNLHYHPAAFADLDEAFDPIANATYAAQFLQALFRDSGSWANAVARYHASVYARNLQYRTRVMRIWQRLRSGG